MRIFSHQNKHKSFISTFFFFFLHLSSCLIWRGTVENPNIYICLFSPLKQTLIFYADTLWLICQNMSSIHTLFIQRFSCTSHSTHAGAGGLIHESHVQKKKIYIYIYALHIQRWEAFGFWIKVSKLHALIFMAGAAVFSPDEAHLRSPSGSSLCLRSPPSAHTPACLRPSWWWSALRSQVRRGKMRLWHGG